MCGIDDRGDLVARHVARGTALETVSGTGEKLDRLCAAADFLTNLPAQCFRSVDEQVDAGRLRGSPPIRAAVEIGGGADVVTAGADGIGRGSGRGKVGGDGVSSGVGVS